MYNHVGNALQNLSGTVKGLGTQIGDNRLANAEMGLKTAEHALMLPGLKLRAQQDQGKLDQMNAPVNITTFGRPNDPLSTIHLLQEHKDKSMPPLYEAIAKQVGATVDPQGNFIKGGRQMTMAELNQHSGQIQRLMAMYTDPDKAIESRKLLAQRDLEGGMLDEETQRKYAGGISKIDNMSDADRLQMYQKHLANLEATKAPFIDSGGDTRMIDAAIERVKGKVQAYQNKLVKAEDRRYTEGQTAEQNLYNSKQAELDRKNRLDVKRLGLGAGKERSAANRKLDFDTAARKAIGEINSMGIPVNQDMNGGYGDIYTQEQAEAMRQVFSKYGHTGYFAPVQTEDTGSGWNPFDNKQVTKYQLVDIVPNSDNVAGEQHLGGQAGARPGGTPTAKPPVEGARQAGDGNWYVQKNGKTFRVDPEKGKSANGNDFDEWYAGVSKKTGLNPDPDDPKHYYDYRAAFKDGVRGPDKTGHWPSKYKTKGHPRMVVDGVNTKTGKKEGDPNRPKGNFIGSKAEREAAKQEAKELFDSLGVGADNWAALYRIAKNTGGWAWDKYLKVYNAIWGQQPSAREALYNQTRAKGK